MSHQFKGIPLQNNGENLCFCNSGTNALLSSEQITSRIFHHHCDTCEILCRLKNSSLPNFQETCTNCGSKTFQEHHEKILMLPQVMIVKLQRYEKNRFNRIIKKNCMDVEPSIILPLLESEYMLNAVVTHYGETTKKGHYITTLYRNGQWIDCNDEVVTPTNNVPNMGYLFFYDRVNNQPLTLPSIPIDIPEVATTIVTEHISSSNFRSESKSPNIKKRKKSENFDEPNDGKPAKKQKQAPNTSSEGLMETFMIECKICKKAFKNIHRHLFSKKGKTDCGELYSDEDIDRLHEMSKIGRKEYKRKYQERNKQKLADYNKAHHQQNKVKILKKKKDNYQQNQDKIAKKRKDPKNKEKTSEYNKKYYQEHTTEKAEANKRCYKKRREDEKNQFIRFRMSLLGQFLYAFVTTGISFREV